MMSKRKSNIEYFKNDILRKLPSIINEILDDENDMKRLFDGEVYFIIKIDYEGIDYYLKEIGGNYRE